MKHLKVFENHNNQPEQLIDLFGKREEKTGRRIQYAVYFKPSGTFSAITNARTWLKDQDYVIGSMCGNDEPIGFSKSVEYVAKWMNISPIEWKKLDGVMISDDFREGGVKILFFVFPE